MAIWPGHKNAYQVLMISELPSCSEGHCPECSFQLLSSFFECHYPETFLGQDDPTAF